MLSGGLWVNKKRFIRDSSSQQQREAREDVVASGRGEVVKTPPSEVVAPKPEPAEEGDETAGFEDEIAKLASESGEFRRHLELDRGARFHHRLGFENRDPVLGDYDER